MCIVLKLHRCYYYLMIQREFSGQYGTTGSQALQWIYNNIRPVRWPVHHSMQLNHSAERVEIRINAIVKRENYLCGRVQAVRYCLSIHRPVIQLLSSLILSLTSPNPTISPATAAAISPPPLADQEGNFRAIGHR